MKKLRDMSYSMAQEIYGDELTGNCRSAIGKRINSIIGHGFAVIYLISHKLVKKSLMTAI